MRVPTSNAVAFNDYRRSYYDDGGQYKSKIEIEPHAADFADIFAASI